uniref:PITH domain-containing protein n=1 Tax=Plectus sambesii TaxID=2011161 RepID=A0A914W3S5_9BILA
MAHHHGHGGACSHEHDHEESDELGVQYSLYQKIDLEKVACLNELVEGSGKTVFKPWDQRLIKDQYVQSDADEELLFNIPFTGQIKLKAVLLVGGEGNSHPAKMRLFKNRPTMSFDDTTIEPEQEFELTRDESGTVEYPLRVAKFANLTHLSIHFPTNFGDESTKIYYIGLRGEFQGELRDQVVLAVYEARAIPQDHKGEIPEGARQNIF